MLDTINPRERFEQERAESVKDIEGILSTAEYDLNELSNFENPRVLVMGTGPYIPEAHVLKEWAESNKKPVEVLCVEKEEIDDLFMQTFLKLENSQYFTMKFLKSTFEQYPFDKRFSLILLLRQPNLSNISDTVYKQIPNSLENEGAFLMSGGYNHLFQGYSLKQPDFNIEVKTPVLWSNTDFYKVYSGENTVFKFRKHNNGI